MNRLIATLAITASCSLLANSALAGGCHGSSRSYGRSNYSQPSYSHYNTHYGSHYIEAPHGQPSSQYSYIVVQGQLYLLVDGKLFPVPTQAQPAGAPFPGQTFAGPVAGQPLPGQAFSGPAVPGQSMNAPFGPDQSFGVPMGSGQPISGPMGGVPSGQPFPGQSFSGQPLPGQQIPGQSLPPGAFGPTGQSAAIGGQPDFAAAGGFSGQPVTGPNLPSGIGGPSLGSPFGDSSFATAPQSSGPVLPPTVDTSLIGPGLPPAAQSTSPVADVARSEVYTGMPLQLAAPGCGDQAGLAVLRFPGFELPLTVNVWREGLIEVQIPMLNVSGNAEATLLIYGTDRTLLAELPLMLINAAQ